MAEVKTGKYAYRELSIQKFPLDQLEVVIGGGVMVLGKQSPLYLPMIQLALEIEQLAINKTSGSSVIYS